MSGPMLRPLCWVLGHAEAFSGGGPSQKCKCGAVWRARHYTCGRCHKDRWEEAKPHVCRLAKIEGK